MGAAAAPLARSLSELWADWRDDACFDVLIVGSGYGGSVAAAGLAGACDDQGRLLRVGLLERGRHWRPGEFASRFADLPGHIRLARQASGVVHGHEALLDVRIGDDVNALVANGLGGGSLINAGVMLQPDPADFAGNPTFQSLLRRIDAAGYFDRARLELGAQVRRNGHLEPNHIDRHADVAAQRLAKTEALESLAAAAGAKPRLVPITIALDDGAEPNSAGVRLPRCTLCGDCMTGCNVGAKDSLDANLLAQAHRQGAEIYTGATVVSITPETSDGTPGDAPCWLVRVAHTNPQLQAREPRLLYLRARHVVLAAGSLGSSEILLRSRHQALAFSARLGEGFSCNGDNIAAVHRMPELVNGSADEDDSGERRVGPTITASFAPSSGPRSYQVQEFAVPAPLRRVFDEAVTTAQALHGLTQADWRWHGSEDDGSIDPLAVDRAWMDRTLLVGVIGHDRAAGALRLPKPVRPPEGPAATGVVSIHWPDARDAQALDAPHDKLLDIVAALKPRGDDPRPSLIANPLWRLLPDALERLVVQPRGPVLTVHPLGGCGIGADVQHGVVDGHGRAFNAAGGLWQGLHVLDGSIVPGSLGVNPALTITALAMHAVDSLRRDRGWLGGLAFDTPRVALPAPVARARVDAPPGITLPAGDTTRAEIVERLVGEATLDIGAPKRRRCMVELTLAYKAQPVRNLTEPLRRSADVDSARSRLRIYDFETWRANHLRVASDAQRLPYVCYEASLAGTLAFLHRGRSSAPQRVLRSTWAWLLNRGRRDLWQEGSDWLRGKFDGDERKRRREQRRRRPAPRQGYLCALVAAATHAGEARVFDYRLDVVQVHKNTFADGDKQPLPGPAKIVGAKQLTYNRRANPWQQLTELSISRMPGLPRLSGTPPVLILDPGFMAGVGVPLLRLAGQRDHASALADLMSFGLLLVRVLLYTHLWTFRKPDPPRRDAPRRLPGTVQGVRPQVTELEVDRVRGRTEPVKIVLSRYLPARAAEKQPALVMLHGYSVSGNTFTHESLDPSAAGYFLDRGREVWVVELRTSAALASATEPWAFEQAALIDLPAALLHVKAVTGDKVDVLAHCIGCAMLGMAILSDAGEIVRNVQQLGERTWLTSEHLGQLSAFNGVRPAGGPHPCIARVVLSQKGPVLRYTDANILRAFLMQSLRRVLLSDDFQFRPPERPTLGDELLDRVLSSLPYPKADYDIENPGWPCKTTGWTTTRHRMDALYGRDFDAANMRPETLEAIDDLFGPINLDTVAQTSHFARFRTITNQAGRGEFVTRGRLRERWGGIPTLAIHGEDNGLADVDTQQLLERHLKGAGVPFEAIEPYRGMGHQDVLIGKQSRRVFDDIERFLAGPRERPGKPDALQGVVLELPWIGPRIVLPEAHETPLELAAMARPDQGRARLGLLPARRFPPRQPGEAQRFEPIDLPRGIAVGERGASCDWLRVEPSLAALDGGDPQAFGFFALLVYEVDETTAFELSDTKSAAAETVHGAPAAAMRRHGVAAPAPAPAAAAAAPARVAALPPAQFQDEQDDTLDDVQPAPVDPVLPPQLGLPIPAPAYAPGLSPPLVLAPAIRAAAMRAGAAALLAGADSWVRQQPQALLARCFVRLADLQRADAQRQAQAPQPGFAFAVGSCQYPHGLVDRGLAGASLQALHRVLGDTALAVLVGDQIYADATAGLLDATRRDERYDAPHDRALRLPGMRALMRRVPVLTLPDDHELVDNWEPLAPAAAEQRPDAQLARARARRDGMRAFYRYQRMAGNVVHEPPVADLALQFAGYPFYLLDTRSGRMPRGSTVDALERQIVSPQQWVDFERWLLAQPRDAIKFVATSALLLPRHGAIAADPGRADAADGWGGYPLSLHRLLDLVARADLRHLVFLSGDEHHALFSEAWVGPQRAKLLSVHSSALYAPFPFANGRPQDVVEHEEIVPPLHFSAGATVHTTFAPPGDGFVRVQPGRAAAGQVPHVVITFHKAAGDDLCYRVLLG